MHAGHVSNDLYNKSNIRDLTNFMVKEPRAETGSVAMQPKENQIHLLSNMRMKFSHKLGCLPKIAPLKLW